MIDCDVDPAGDDPVAVGDGVTVTASDGLERVDFVRYAGASGDFNPLHVDETRAREAGHDSVFAHGMLLCGVASQVLSGWLGAGNVTALRTRFVAPAAPGDAVVVRWTVTDRGEAAGVPTVDADVEVTDGDGETFLTGEATARRPGR